MLSSPGRNKTDSIRTDVYVYNLIKEIILKKKYDVPNCLYELEERKKKFKIYDKLRQCSDSEKQVKNSG
jgi:hypothetical protein